MKSYFLAAYLFVSVLFSANLFGQDKMHLVIPQGHTNDIEHLLITRDDRYLISGGYDRVVNFYDLKQQKLLKAFKLFTDSGSFRPTKLQFNGKQTKVLISCEYAFFILDIPTLTLKSYYLNDAMMGVLSLDEKTIYATTKTEGFAIDLATGKTIKLFTATQKEEFSNLRLSTTGRYLYFCSQTQVSKYDLFTKKRQIFTIPNLLEVLPNGQLLALNLVDEYKDLYCIKLYDQVTLKEIYRIDFKGISSSFKYVLYNSWVEWDNWGWYTVDAKRHRIVLTCKKDAITYDYIQKTVSISKKYEIPFATSIAVLSSVDEWVIGFGEPDSPLDIRKYNAATNKFSESLLKGGFSSRYLSAAKHNNGFVCSPTISDDIKYFKVTESAKQVQLVTWGGKFKSKDKTFANVGEAATLSPDGKIISATNYYGRRMVAEANGLGKSAFSSKTMGQIYTIDYSNNGLIAYFSYSTIAIYDANDAKIKLEFSIGGNNPTFQGIKLGAIAGDGKTVFVRYGRSGDVLNEHIAAFNAENGIKIWDRKLPSECTLVQLSTDGTKLNIAFAMTLEELNPTTGGLLSSKKFVGHTNSYIYALSNDASKIYTQTFNGGDEQHVFTTIDQKILFKFPHLSPGEAIFLKNDSLMVTSNSDGMKIWNVYEKKELASIYVFKETNSYLAITPEGLFDGTDDAIKSIYFVEGKEVVPVESFYEHYYTPNLLARILSRQKLPIVNDVRKLNPRPTVKLNYAVKTRNLKVTEDKLPNYTNTTGLAEIAIEAAAVNDRIDEVRLFHNGKIINIAGHNLLVTDEKTGRSRRTFTINLLPGINTFRGIALNTQRTESSPDELTINYIGTNTEQEFVNTEIKSNIDRVDKNATLHLIVVGINAYQNPQMRLNYALSDATAFKNQIETGAKTIIKDIKTYFVTDENANKKGITSAFEEVLKFAKPQDLFIFYYAGHGVISEKNSEFYLVPNDVVDLKNVDEALSKSGVPSKFLQQFAVNIKAQKQLFILDACQSAGAFASLMSNDAAQQKNMALVARSTGTHWMAASGSQQFSQEFSQLGHGGFTYVLLAGLNGKAQEENLITVNGLKNYINMQVPLLMKKYNGSQQIPVSYGFGNDFPVESIK